jgi:hypothetical protein
VLHFNARGPDGLLDGKSPGQRVEAVARAKACDCDAIEIWFADEAR